MDAVIDLAFTVPGEPRSTQRPRVTRKGTYTPQGSLDAQERVLAAFLAERERRAALEIDTWPCEPGRQYGVHMIFHRGRYGVADADNLIKTVLDGLNGHAFPDDSQATRGSWSINWGPRLAGVPGWTTVRLERLSMDVEGRVLPLYPPVPPLPPRPRKAKR